MMPPVSWNVVRAASSSPIPTHATLHRPLTARSVENHMAWKTAKWINGSVSAVMRDGPSTQNRNAAWRWVTAPFGLVSPS